MLPAGLPGRWCFLAFTCMRSCSTLVRKMLIQKEKKENLILIIDYFFEKMSSYSRRSHKREFIKDKGEADSMMSRHQGRIRMSVQIRKAKKSALLTFKRKCSSTSSSFMDDNCLEQERHVDVSAHELVKLVSAYLCSEDNVALLHPLLMGISNCSSEVLDDMLQILSTPPTPAFSSSSSSALSFINRLASTLLDETMDDIHRFNAAKILTNLAATTTTTSTNTVARESDCDDDDDHVYGGTATMKEWCYLIIQSNALNALLQVISSFVRNNENSKGANTVNTSLCEQCCWVIANLAGDSYRSRMTIMEKQITPSISVPSLLVSVLQVGINTVSSGLCRNTIWTIRNLLRGQSTTDIIHQYFLSARHNDASGTYLLKSKMVIQLLVAPEMLSPAVETMKSSVAVSWNEVAIETCWMVSSLTAKDDDVVKLLCSYSDANSPCTTVFHALEVRLRAATEAVCHDSIDGILSDSTTGNAAIPCIRSVSNIAMACDGNYIPQLIANEAILKSLSTLIEYGAAGPISSTHGSSLHCDISLIASEAAWSAGSLLFFTFEQSSTAYQILIPSLCSALVSNTSALSLKREAISSLVNAVSAQRVAISSPVDALSVPSLEKISGIVTIQDPDAVLLAILNVDHMIPVLVQLLSHSDMETVVMALHLVNASFRRLLNVIPEGFRFRQLFEECSILDALESICDRAASLKSASSNNNISWFASEMAADLIDDFFSDERLTQQEDVLEDERCSSFKFGLNPNEPFKWNHTNVTAFEEGSQSTIRSIGRGRSNIPSWMQQP